MSSSQPAAPRDERLAIVIGVVILVSAVSALIALPSQDLILSLFGSELALRFSGPVQIMVMLILLVCAGVDGLVQRPSRLQRPTLARSTAGQTPVRQVPWPYRAAYYSLPVTLTSLGLVAVHSLQWWAYQLAAAVLLGFVLLAVISMQLATAMVDTRSQSAQRLALNALSYALAIVLFSLVFGARLRSLLSATGIMLVSGLIALEFYRNSETSAWRIWLYAGLTALLMGQLTWALNYTAFTTRAGAAALLLGFYALTGMVQQGLWNRLTTRVVIEYVVVLFLGLLAIVVLL